MSLLTRTRQWAASSGATDVTDRVSRLPVVLAGGALVVALLVVSGILDASMTALVPSGMLVSLRQLLGGIVVLGLVGALLVEWFGEAYLAALWITTPRLPGLLAVAWLLVDIAPPLAAPETLPATAKLGIGLFVAILSWLVITVPFRRVGMPATSQTQTYGEIIVRYNQLRARCEACNPTANGRPLPIGASVGHAEAARQLRLVRTMLGLPEEGMAPPTPPTRTGGALAWATGAGYVNAWEALNRVDEALIEVEPASAVIGEGLHDMLRLSESSIKNAGHLQDALRAAVRHFDPDADRLYFFPQRRRLADHGSGTADSSPASERAAGDEASASAPTPATPAPASGQAAPAMAMATPNAIAAAAAPVSAVSPAPGSEVAAVPDSAVAAVDAPNERPASLLSVQINTTATLNVGTGSHRQPTETIADAAARAVIREVRHAVSEYRDGRRSAILRARNRLLRTILVTGIAADVLLGLVILEGVETRTLATAAAFFLIGGVVGLFNRLRLEGDSGAAMTPDYGLFDARLLHTLLISGLAGVGGVFLMSAVPAASSIVSPNAVAVGLTPLGDVFDPEKNRIGLLIAAVFGLTPDLIIGKLRQQTDALKQDLSSSEAAVPGTTADARR